MIALAHPVYRPTLHQIRVLNLDPVDTPGVLVALRDAVEHVARVLAPEDTKALRDQVAPSRQLLLQPRDTRHPLVRSTTLYRVLNQPPLHAALLAYQEGGSLLLHFSWHWDDKGNEETIRRHLLTRRWSGPSEGVPGDWGESLLLTAVPLAGKECGATHAAAFFRLMALPAEVPLLPLTLDGAALYVPQWLPSDQTTWPAVLLFHDREAEDSAAANRLVGVDWPLVVLYHLRLQHYYQDYRERVAPQLQQRLEAMSTALANVFTPSGTKDRPSPHVLTTANPNRLQDAVEQLAGPQYALLETLGEAETAQHHVRRELENLQQRFTQMPMVASTSAMAPMATADTLHAALAGRAQQGLRQIEADVAQVHYQAERRAGRAMEVLRTQTEILNTRYDRHQNWVIGLLGVFLTLGQVLDKDVARLLYINLGVERVWTALGGAPLSLSQLPEELGLLYIRLGSIVTLTVLIATLIATLIALRLRLQKWWKARWR